mmetsp:Transcript_2435/g.9508  ORF Transcript_2435/g.9508 Transcript_2435/m.9508 type:complete len:125 (+) Transcript_2435:652-1026(+)
MQVERFDPATNAWAELPRRSGHPCKGSAALLGKLYVCGGGLVDGEKSMSFERFNPDTNLWEQLPPPSFPLLCGDEDWKNFWLARWHGKLYVLHVLFRGDRNFAFMQRFDVELQEWEQVDCEVCM